MGGPPLRSPLDPRLTTNTMHQIQNIRYTQETLLSTTPVSYTHLDVYKRQVEIENQNNFNTKDKLNLSTETQK